MNKEKTIADIRREYGELSLNNDEILDNPFEQFKLWFSDILRTESFDPTAMVLSTVDEVGHPDSRVVLLKGIENETFVFFTNYNSNKAKQLALNPYAALNFYWASMARQIRIRGPLTKITEQQSEAYFLSRPVASQWSALVSPQSSEINTREELIKKLSELQEQNFPLHRPSYWGGYCVKPEEFEFWQGRDNRLHDRIQYRITNKAWIYRRLAP